MNLIVIREKKRLKEIDEKYIILKNKMNNVMYGYYEENDYRRLCVEVINLVNDIIEDKFESTYVFDTRMDVKKPVVSPLNRRYVSCIFCGELLDTSKMIAYGGTYNGTSNYGICKKCNEEIEKGVDVNEETYIKFHSFFSDSNIVRKC